MARFDPVVLDGTAVLPYVGAVRRDVGVGDGRIAALADALAPAEGDVVVDARGRPRARRRPRWPGA